MALTFKPLSVLPDLVPLGNEKRLTSEFLFNGHYITSTRGLAFKIYTPTAIDTETRIKGVGVFLNDSTQLDEWLETGEEFSFDYFPWPTTRKLMEGCHVESSHIYRTGDDAVFKTYFFDCQYVWAGTRQVIGPEE